MLKLARRRVYVVVAGLAVALTAVAAVATATSSSDWSMSGQDISNWRYQPNAGINAGNVDTLKVAWAASLGGDISATPAVVDGVAYVPDWGGFLNAVDTKTGQIIWKSSVGTLAGAAGQLGVTPAGTVGIVPGPVVSRTSPAVQGNTVVIGTQTMRAAAGGDGAQLLAVDKRNGQLLWRTKLDDHPLSIDSQSPTIFKGVVYVGVASIEENGVDCGASRNACNFRGSEQAIRLSDGAVQWKTYTISSQQSQAGYSGAAVWGSSPAIDPSRKSVYVTTGNNYGAPPEVSACVAAAGVDPAAIFNCEQTMGIGNYVDSVMSLDMTTGAIKWVSKLQGFDAWTTACIGLPTACPSPNGPDYDFGQGAMFIPTKNGDLVAAGQKSGIMWALHADTGAVAWKTTVGPGSSLGGLEWGSATDGKRIYFAVANFNFGPYAHYAMINPPPGTPAYSDAGSWGAIDAATGQVLWQTADPNGSIDLGPVSVSNDVVYAGSMGALFFPADLPTMFAFDAASGKTLWSYTAGGSVNAGPAIADGQVIWGSGYSHLGFGGANNKLYAFSRNGK